MKVFKYDMMVVYSTVYIMLAIYNEKLRAAIG